MAELWHFPATQERENTPEPQIVKYTVDIVVTAPKEHISERALEQLAEALDDPIPCFRKEIVEVIKSTGESNIDSSNGHDEQIVNFPAPQILEESVEVVKNNKERV